MLATSQQMFYISALAAFRTKDGFPRWPRIMAASILVSHINVSHITKS